MLNMILTSKKLNFIKNAIKIYLVFVKLLRYTRNLIDNGNGKFNILLLCWAESQGSSIHDHSNAHCFMKCMDGELMETKYEWPEKTEDDSEKEMVEKCRTVLQKNQVAYINGKLVLSLNFIKLNQGLFFN